MRACTLCQETRLTCTAGHCDNALLTGVVLQLLEGGCGCLLRGDKVQQAVAGHDEQLFVALQRHASHLSIRAHVWLEVGVTCAWVKVTRSVHARTVTDKSAVEVVHTK